MPQADERRAVSFDKVEQAAREAGLRVRGGFIVEGSHGVPGLDAQTPAQTLVLLGNAGPGMWQAFAGGGVEHDDNPLDRWSLDVISSLANRLGGAPLFPFAGPPFLPFIRWAQAAEAVRPSPIGPLIHPEFGLWHAYRGAIAFAHAMALPPHDDRPRPCDTCATKPCLSACPVGAFTADGYDVPACVSHLSADAGEKCLNGGCLARHACPIGKAYAYSEEQAAFHMRAFLKGRLSSN